MADNLLNLLLIILISKLTLLAFTLFTLAFPPWIFGMVCGIPIFQLAWGSVTYMLWKVSDVCKVAQEAVCLLLSQLMWVLQIVVRMPLIWARLRMPLILAFFSWVLRIIRRGQNRILASAFYITGLCMIQLMFSRLPVQYACTAVFSWIAILVWATLVCMPIIVACKVAKEAVCLLLSQLIWVLERVYKVASKFVKESSSFLVQRGRQVLLYTGQNIEFLIITSVVGTHGLFVRSSRKLQVINSRATYVSHWFHLLWAGLVRMPVILVFLSWVLRVMRREQSQILAGAAFYSAVMGILQLLVSRLPIQYAFTAVFSWTAILVLGAVFLRAPGRFY